MPSPSPVQTIAYRWYWALCLVFLPALAAAFSVARKSQHLLNIPILATSTRLVSSQPSPTAMHLFPLPWSSKKGGSKDKKDVWGDEAAGGSEDSSSNSENTREPASTVAKSSNSNTNKAGIGGVAGIMDSMENFKTAQQVGKMTNSLVQDLQKETFEGVAVEGKVKVLFDGQQRPVGVQIDDTYLADADASELSSALTSAMKEAYQKSSERMDEKMKLFYIDLGLKK